MKWTIYARIVVLHSKQRNSPTLYIKPTNPISTQFQPVLLVYVAKNSSNTPLLSFVYAGNTCKVYRRRGLDWKLDWWVQGTREQIGWSANMKEAGVLRSDKIIPSWVVGIFLVLRYLKAWGSWRNRLNIGCVWWDNGSGGSESSFIWFQADWCRDILIVMLYLAI